MAFPIATSWCSGCPPSFFFFFFFFFFLIIFNRPIQPSMLCPLQVHLLRCNFLNNRVVLDASSVQVWSYLPYGESSLPLVLEDWYVCGAVRTGVLTVVVM